MTVGQNPHQSHQGISSYKILQDISIGLWPWHQKSEFSNSFIWETMYTIWHISQSYIKNIYLKEIYRFIIRNVEIVAQNTKINKKHVAPFQNFNYNFYNSFWEIDKFCLKVPLYNLLKFFKWYIWFFTQPYLKKSSFLQTQSEPYKVGIPLVTCNLKSAGGIGGDFAQ